MRWLALLLALMVTLQTPAPQTQKEPVCALPAQTAAAVVRADGAWWLLSADGTILEESAGPDDHPQILGLTPVAPKAGEALAVAVGEKEKLAALKRLLAAMETQGLDASMTDFVDLSEDGVIYFNYGPSLTIKVPDSGEVPTLLHMFRGMEEYFIANGERMEGTLELTWGTAEARLLPERWLPPAWAER